DAEAKTAQLEAEDELRSRDGKRFGVKMWRKYVKRVVRGWLVRGRCGAVISAAVV
ncbi:hypothetical protein U1Q18_052133, partial [Sarracenia purpurea var. burkii]